jgi:hypothetical protein
VAGEEAGQGLGHGLGAGPAKDGQDRLDDAGGVGLAEGHRWTAGSSWPKKVSASATARSSAPGRASSMTWR